jgi:DNA-binding response OmpR family regulator
LGRSANDAQQVSRLAECLEIVAATICSIRNRALELRPSMLDDFLSKPFDRAELCARVRTIVRLNRYRKLIE